VRLANAVNQSFTRYRDTTERPAISYLPKNDHCKHGHNDDYRSHDQPVSRGFSLPRRPHFLLFRVACGSLCCPSGLFFLSGFFVSSAIVLSFALGAVVVCGSCNLRLSPWLTKSWDMLHPARLPTPTMYLHLTSEDVMRACKE
jgi:hypothetical protein